MSITLLSGSQSQPYDANRGDLRVATWSGASFDGIVVDEVNAVDAEGEPLMPTPDNSQTSLRMAIHSMSAIMISSRRSSCHKQWWLMDFETIDSEGDVGQWSTMHIENGTIHIAYHDVTIKISMCLRNWFLYNETVDEGAYVGADTDIAVIGNDIHIAYFDGQNNDMKLATLSGGAWSSNLGCRRRGCWISQ